jgi:serine/threonine-protein kinase
MIGKTILHYKILGKLGEGGMGVVYKAEDTKLERVVALKFLPTNTLTGAEEKKRFKREAKAAAALNHPNICHIYAIDEANDQLFIAMEFIEGKSLAEMVAGAYGGVPLPLNDAINYASQIATGLQAAHEKDITHRDIKSANIMVTDKGQVKIMDFGLAKLGNRSMLTKEGRTLGTAAYMSPEQARGEAVDHRTDIGSLGVVLYEMISGQLPFRGGYEQAMMYSICHEDPQPLTALRTGVPLALDGIIAKALAKDPSVRYQHVDELPADLKAAREASKSTSKHLLAKKWRPPQKKQIWFWGIATTLIGMLVGVAVWEWLRPVRSTPAAVTRFHVPLPEGQHTAESGAQAALALSPDGKYLVYVAKDGKDQRLYLRPMDALQAKPIAGTEGASTPFFSPDGQWIGFFADNMLKKVPTTGGPALQITQAPTSEAVGATWNRDDVIVYTLTFRAGLNRVSAWGRRARSLDNARS